MQFLLKKTIEVPIFQNVFADTFHAILAKSNNKDIVAITAAMREGTGSS